MRTLAICPSLNRPEMLRRMKDSFYATVHGDIDLKIISDDCTVTECFNRMFKAFPDYDFYHMTNDDVVYKSLGWDNLLAKKGTISYGDDGFQGAGLCTFPTIDGDIVRALGYLQQPTLKKYCGDCVWMEIGRYAGCIRYVPDAKLEHHHFVNNKRENDDPNFWETYTHDKLKLANWVANDSVKEIKMIRRLIHEHKSDSQLG